MGRIASCGVTFDSVLEQHWLQDHIGSNYHTRCTESTASPAHGPNNAQTHHLGPWLVVGDVAVSG